MFILEGKYNKAYVYAEYCDENAVAQIINFLNNEVFANGRIAIMPDVHAGSGAVIGFTGELSDKIIPAVIGVDIGCGCKSWKLGNSNMIGEQYQKLDDHIRERIPSGMTVRSEAIDLDKFTSDPGKFLEEVKRICDTIEIDHSYVTRSLGTLGGGNHMCEVNKDDKSNLWLTIHSGSRNFGLKIAMYHQKKALDKMGSYGGLEYLEGDDALAYIKDMKIAQQFAQINRDIMGWQIYKKFYNVKPEEVVESVHNYINFDDKIIRKGAISAHAGEKVLIPLNMADGVIIGTGKGNADWNNSAPHGAGRRMSRGDAKRSVSLESFQASMKDVWSSCVGKNTLDEAPMAYKRAEDIVDVIKESVDINNIMKPVYNFKATEENNIEKRKRMRKENKRVRGENGTIN